MNVETNEHPLERDAAGPARVIMTLNVKETSELADDLRALCALACDGGGMDEETARVVDRVTTLAQLLQRQLGHLAQPAARTEEADMGTMLAPRQDHPQEALGAFKGIPVEHVEWALKVYRLTASHSRASVNATLERVFEKGEAQARSFFVQTQNVWNMRVRGGEAAAYEVVLGVQDARKHKKKGSFREVDRVLCTGQVA